MREFFTGWKRKAGVATLGLACLFAAGWVRSMSIVDLIQIRTASRRWHEFAISDGLIRCWSINADTVPLERVPESFHWRRFDIFEALTANGDEPMYRWSQNRFSRFRAPDFWPDYPSMIPCQLFVSYGLIVGLLTLLAAWLLFSKPRPAKNGGDPRSR